MRKLTEMFNVKEGTVFKLNNFAVEFKIEKNTLFYKDKVTNDWHPINFGANTVSKSKIDYRNPLNEKESKFIKMFIDIYKDKFTHIYSTKYIIQLVQIVDNCEELRNVLGVFDTTEELAFKGLPQNKLIPLSDLLLKD